MINKISPNPSFLKRGREKVKIDPHDYAKTQLFLFDAPPYRRGASQ
jgi:hypothetical protein